MLRKKARDRVVFFFGITSVVKREAEELHLAPCHPHEWNNRGLAAHDLTFEFLDRLRVKVRMRESMIAEVEAASGPLLKDRRTRGWPQVSRSSLNNEACNGNPVMGQSS